ncbi:MAG: hypothetical protein GC206_07440 [Alphaproteobacteria bacterium]|nr:hypothetical protein [Alphaproteobacteria bacterium]
MSAQSGGGAVLWALAALVAGAALYRGGRWAFARVRALIAFPDLDFSRGYDALAPITAPRLYLVKR